ncbi:glycosyltransferase family 2 protein [Anaerorhabdus sp.]|uniref:glycosyltransferase family 2 protein n=1 Tax=Anaerorhabdus sp. TaxID=1872524 RepID=UPI002FCBD82E
MRICLIIPAFNEEKSIMAVVNDIETNLNQCDYVVINDCSTDSTKLILEKKGINHVTLPVNVGLSGAVQTGFKYAYENKYDCAIQFDGDGQHQAKYVMELSREIAKGNDIVIGSRFVTEKKDFSMRMIGSRIISTLIKLKTGVFINDPTSGMRMFNREMMKDYAYNINRKPEPETLVYQLKNGRKIKEIQVEMNEREGGISLYSSVFASLKYMIKTIIAIVFIY